MPLIDYFVVTPLDEEWDSVTKVLLPPDAQNVPIDNTTYTNWKYFVDRRPDWAGEYLISGASVARWTPGEAEAGIFVSQCITQWIPSRVIMLGIAGSLDSKVVGLGDVIVSDHLYGYEVGDVYGKEVEHYSFRETFNQLDALAQDRMRAFIRDKQAVAKWQANCEKAAAGYPGLGKLERPPVLHLGTVASGNFVVKSVAFGKVLKEKINKYITAVEMEALGMHKALYRDAAVRNSLMIRGISDCADEDKEKLEQGSSNAWRKYAAGNAARLLKAIWDQGLEIPASARLEMNMEMEFYERFRQPGIPFMGSKTVGSQSISFPSLLVRRAATPALYLEVQAWKNDHLILDGYRGQVIITTDETRTEPGKFEVPGTMTFRIPKRSDHYRVELQLHFPESVARLMVKCYDRFGRSIEKNVDLLAT